MDTFKDINVSININAHMYKSELYLLSGNADQFESEHFEAEILALQDGYRCQMQGQSEPEYIARHPSLYQSWIDGAQSAQSYIDCQECSQCQDPDVDLCSLHDR